MISALTCNFTQLYATCNFMKQCNFTQLYATLRNMQLYATMKLTQLYATLRYFMQHATMQLMQLYATLCNNATICDLCNYMQLYATYECVTYILLMQLMNATISS
jgi:hypothetical protein